jgi:hypothetical protein
VRAKARQLKLRLVFGVACKTIMARFRARLSC